MRDRKDLRYLLDVVEQLVGGRAVLSGLRANAKTLKLHNLSSLLMLTLEQKMAVMTNATLSEIAAFGLGQLDRGREGGGVVQETRFVDLGYVLSNLQSGREIISTVALWTVICAAYDLIRSDAYWQ